MPFHVHISNRECKVYRRNVIWEQLYCLLKKYIHNNFSHKTGKAVEFTCYDQKGLIEGKYRQYSMNRYYHLIDVSCKRNKLNNKNIRK